MVKVRPTTPEEEQAFAEAGGGEVVLSEQVREFMKAEGMSEDEFIAMLLKEGNREQ